MKRILLMLATTAAFVLTVRADDATTINLAPPPEATPAADNDKTADPGEGFPAKRYEALWTKSPFAVETSEAVAESPDYSLVGVAEVDGVSYASIVERNGNQRHFLISSDKAVNDLTLKSVSRGQSAADTSVVMLKNGQPITLKIEQAPITPAAPVPGAPAMNLPGPQGGTLPPQLPMPGAQPSAGNPTPVRPLIRIHRSAIHLPPRTDQAAPAPPPAPPTPAK